MSEIPPPVYKTLNYQRGKEAILAAHAPRQTQQSETKTSTPTVAELQERLTTLGAEPDESPDPSTTTATNK